MVDNGSKLAGNCVGLVKTGKHPSPMELTEYVCRTDAHSAGRSQTYPDLVFASHASSAPLEAIEDFWTYYEPIRQGMPKVLPLFYLIPETVQANIRQLLQNCSADVLAVIAFVDETLESNDRNMIKKLKSAFGLGEVTFDDDFASAIAWPIQQWQDITSAWGINKAATSDFYDVSTRSLRGGTRREMDGVVEVAFQLATTVLRIHESEDSQQHCAALRSFRRLGPGIRLQ